MTYMGRLSPKVFLFQDRQFYVFFFFFPPLEKKCLEIRKFAKFESDLLKTNEDMLGLKVGKFYKRLYGEGSGTVLAVYNDL